MADQRRLGALVEAALGRLRAFVARRTSPGEVDDVVQETLANLVAADQIARIDQVGAWLFRAARNELADRGRKIREAPWPEWDEADPEWSEISSIMAAPPGDPETGLLRNLFWEELAAALDEMPPAQRDVFVRTEFEGRSLKELSSLTGVSVGGLISRKRRAVIRLRLRLQEVYDLLLVP